LLCYCRAGFEPELAAELGERAAHAGFGGHARTERGSGFVVFGGVDGAALSHALPWRELIFARQKLVLLTELRELDPRDRIAPMLDALQGYPTFGDVWVEYPDTDAGKPLAGLARSFGNALRPALRKAHLLRTAYSMRQELTALWSRSGTSRPASADQLLEQLRDWRARAEASVIAALREFARRLPHLV